MTETTKETIKICNFEFTILSFPSGNSMALIPMGNTKQEKKMFDDLVYNNPKIYTGTSKIKIKEDIRYFITNYKPQKDEHQKNT